MLRDCFVRAGPVAADELSEVVDIGIVHIDPSDSQFFWAVIVAEPYVSSVSITGCCITVMFVIHIGTGTCFDAHTNM
jgi:hypothetical protein